MTRQTHSKALVEQRWTEGWAGEIRIETQRGQAQVLLDRLLRLIDDRNESFGARATARTRSTREAPSETIEDSRRKTPSFDFKSERAPGPLRYVSYAQGDDTDEGRHRVAVVDQLCAAAKAKGTAIRRDAVDMKTGDSITKFMKDLGAGDRVFIVLSGKYLRSAYCMFELYEVWRNCRLDTEQLRRAHAGLCVAFRRAQLGPGPWRADRFLALGEQADCRSPDGRPRQGQAQGALRLFHDAEIHPAYLDNHRSLRGHPTRPDGGGVHRACARGLGVSADYRRMTRFVNETANILKLVQDVLRPRTFEAFVKYGHDDAAA